MLVALQRHYGTRVRFVGIDVNDTRTAARAFEHRFRIDFPSIFDPGANLATKLGVFGLPTGYLADRKGGIAAVLIGRQQRRSLESLLRLLLKRERPPK